MSLPDFQLGVRGEEALVVCWAALGFFAYSLWGVSRGVWGWGDLGVNERGRRLVCELEFVSYVYFKADDGYIPVVILRCGEMQSEVVKMSR
jgi:hypothetical protein